MLYKRRKKFKNIEIEIGRIFSKFGLRPNEWSFISLLFALITFFFLIKKNFLIAAIFFAFTAFIDVIDGAVARFMKIETKIGAYLDTIIDRFVEFIVLLALFFIDYPNFIFESRFWLFLLLFGGTMTTYAKAAAFEKRLTNQEIKGGIMERAERLIAIFLVIIVSNFNLSYATSIISIAAILSNISAIQRIIFVFQHRK